jgi:hypothetical protein
MDDFDDLRPRMSAPAQPERDREKPGAERPGAHASTPDVYEAVQAARGAAGGKGPRGSRRPAPRAKRGKPGTTPPAPPKSGAAKDLDVPATVSAIAIGALIGFLVGFFAGRERK